MFEFNGTILVAMLSFVVFMFIMNAIFYRPILSIIKKREDFYLSNKTMADGYKQNAIKNDSEYNSKLEKEKDECRNMVSAEVDKAQRVAFEYTQSEKEKAKEKIRINKENILKEQKKIISEIEDKLLDDIAESITNKITEEVQ